MIIKANPRIAISAEIETDEDGFIKRPHVINVLGMPIVKGSSFYERIWDAVRRDLCLEAQCLSNGVKQPAER
jgi:hypothetical protein